MVSCEVGIIFVSHMLWYKDQQKYVLQRISKLSLNNSKGKLKYFAVS